jgi:tetratricopeptide (TPR) repeat protein
VLGQLEAALADCTTARRLDPNNAAILDNLGLTYLKLQRPDQALADYDEALKLDPQKARALFGRGIALRNKGDVAGAEANFTAAKAIQNDIAEEVRRFGVPGS